MPEAIRVKRQTQNMAAHARKKMRAIISPDDQYQAMALTYMRPMTSNMADPVRRSTLTHEPTAGVREAAAPRRRVQFAPATDFVTTLDAPNDSDTDVEEAHLPQSFRHGLPRSSLEPRTNNLLYPPSHLFPDPPLGEGEPLTRKTPLQVAARL